MILPQSQVCLVVDARYCQIYIFINAKYCIHPSHILQVIIKLSLWYICTLISWNAECIFMISDILYTFVAISKCTNAWSEIKTKPRNKQKPSQICKCYIFFAGHSCTSTFSICVITCRNLVLVPAVIISLCDQIFSMGPRLPKIS